jgi:hypothetical protein
MKKAPLLHPVSAHHQIDTVLTHINAERLGAADRAELV